MSRRGYLAAAGAASLAGLSGCLDQLRGATQTTETVRMSYVPVSSLGPLFLAMDEGYFEERNIEIQLERLPVSQIYPQLSTGQLDAAHIALAASIYNSVADDINVALVADVVRTNPGVPAVTRIMIREALYEEGMTIADLPDGFTWALITSAGVNEYVTAIELHQRGMTFDDIDVTTMSFPDMIPAMGSESIDVASIAFPLAGAMEQETGAKHYRYWSEPAPELQIAGMVFGDTLLNQQPDVGRRWLEAYVLGIKDYYELTYYDDRVIGLLNENLEIPEPALRASPAPLTDRNGHVRGDSIMRQQELLACRGHVENPVDRDAVINTELLESALDNVGRSQDSTPAAEVFDEWAQNAARPFPPLQEEYDLSGFPSESVCQ